MKQSLIALAFATLAANAHALTLPSPVTDNDYYDNGQPSAAKVELGRQLFFDKILSGNRNISCGTCHHPEFMGSDGLSVSIGEGGAGLGTDRTGGTGRSAIKERIGRHSPHLFNLGAREFVKLNWQGRHEQTAAGLALPCKTRTADACPTGMENVLAGQNLFPLVNIPEMPGHPSENNIVNAVPRGVSGVDRFPYMWEAITKRVRNIPAYATQFKSVYGLQSEKDMNVVHIVNAIAAFEAKAFRSDNSPFDAYLRGDTNALTPAQERGMELFYGDAGCSSCHSGKFQTDHDFHAIAMPQIGPGVFINGRSTEQRDIGRAEVTGKDADKFKFRTPSLRNIALTAPYGHTGAYASLEGVIRHHLDPVTSFNNWDRSQAILPAMPSGVNVNDFAVMDSATRAAEITSANQLAPSTLSDEQIADLIEFLGALTDNNITSIGSWVPASVPSGLPVAD